MYAEAKAGWYLLHSLLVPHCLGLTYSELTGLLSCLSVCLSVFLCQFCGRQLLVQLQVLLVTGVGNDLSTERQ